MARQRAHPGSRGMQESDAAYPGTAAAETGAGPLDTDVFLVEQS